MPQVAAKPQCEESSAAYTALLRSELLQASSPRREGQLASPIHSPLQSPGSPNQRCASSYALSNFFLQLADTGSCAQSHAAHAAVPDQRVGRQRSRLGLQHLACRAGATARCPSGLPKAGAQADIPLPVQGAQLFEAGPQASMQS